MKSPDKIGNGREGSATAEYVHNTGSCLHHNMDVKDTGGSRLLLTGIGILGNGLSAWLLHRIQSTASMFGVPSYT